MERRVGNEAAIPINFAVNFGGRESGRKGAAGHDVRRADATGRIVEKSQISGLHIRCADAEAHGAGVDPVEIDKAFERGLQRGGIVKAKGVGAPWGNRKGGGGRGVKK